MCGWRELAARPRGGCVVYSMGGSANTQFEQAIIRTTSCEVHTFDLDCHQRCHTYWCYGGPRIKCHKVRIGGKSNSKTVPPMFDSYLGQRCSNLRAIQIVSYTRRMDMDDGRWRDKYYSAVINSKNVFLYHIKSYAKV